MSTPLTTPAAPIAPRAHLYRPIVDEAGNLATYATVTVYTDDGVTLYPGTIYRAETTEDTWPNPLIAAPGLVDIYLDQQTRVVLGIALADGAQQVRTPPIDVVADPAMLVTSSTPVLIARDMPSGALLATTDASSPYWRLLKIEHQHALDGEGSLYLGRDTGFSPQVATWPRTTVIGAGAGTDIAPGGMADSTALGTDAAASGVATTALGVRAVASEQPAWPWLGTSTALAVGSWARGQGVALGRRSRATDGRMATAIGREAISEPAGVAAGPFAVAGAYSISLGFGTGESSRGMPGSIGIGSDVQYGLPSTVETGQFAVLLGSHDPSTNIIFPWDNPAGSQQESPLDEYRPEMVFEDKTIQLQRHLSAVLPGGLDVDGLVSLGRRGSSLGFYGAAVGPQRGVGDDEPSSGIEALDSLIYALRDLGLFASRNEAVAAFTATDLLDTLLDGDDVTSWPEHAGTDTAVPPADGRAPTFVLGNPDFNRRPTVAFTNGVLGRRPMPAEAMLGRNLVTRARHVLAVAEHDGSRLGTHEGLVNFVSRVDRAEQDEEVVFRSWRSNTTFWDPVPLGPGARYENDALDQTSNFNAQLDDGAQLYRLTKAKEWPTSSMVIGGPAGAVPASVADYWRGSISTVTVLDDTWNEYAVDSMTTGLMFRHGICERDHHLRGPALDFIIRQHDPRSRMRLHLDEERFDDPNFLGTICGSVSNIEDRLIDVPWVNIWRWFECYEYWGPLIGYWANLPDKPGHRHPDYRRYRVRVTSSRKNRVIDIAESEWLFGFCWLEDIGLWTTGCDWTRVGYKKAYLIDTWTNKVLATSGHPSRQYDDLEVRGYVVNPQNGELIQQDTSPIWAGCEFDLLFVRKGKKVIRVYRVSTGEVLVSTEWQDRSLPRAFVPSSDDPDYTQGMETQARTYDCAIAAMALCEAGTKQYRRARVIISTLVSVMNSDGSINDNYDSLFPQKGAGSYSTRSIVWFGLAILHYQSVTGDVQFFWAAERVARWLFNHQHNGLIPASSTDPSYRTEDNASAYFFYQRYSEVLAENTS